jgi:hypothetical protein
MKFKDSENIQRLLMEMPQWADPIGDNTFEDLSKIPIEQLKSRTIHSHGGINFEIRAAEDKRGNTILFYIKNNTLVAGYTFDDFSDYIKTVSSWNNPINPGSFYNFFVEYIIPTFHTIESDNKLTALGYKFWQKLVRDHPNLHLYVNKNGNYGKVSDMSQLDRFFGKDPKYASSTFIVTDIEL